MQSQSKVSSNPRRAKAPLTLAFAALMGATALTVPFFLSEPNPVTAAAHAATQVSVPAQGFADLVERVQPAVVSVQVENGFKTSSSRFHRQFEFPDDMMERFFGRRHERFRPQSFNDSENGGNQEQVDADGRNPLYQDIRQRGRRHRFDFHPTSQGSGFIISADGYVVTNNHVVDDSERVKVKTSDGKSYDARLIGTDKKTDLALLKIESDDTFQYVEFADTPGRVGDWVLAVGNPFGLGGTVTTGIISAKGRDLGAGPYDDYIQIDAPINQGNSGGPAFNLQGKVVGVNTAIFSPTGGNVGIGFAIPASVARDVIEDLKDDGSVSRGWLGVQIQSITSEIAEGLGLDHTKGAIISMIQNGSPAEQAGLKVGDLVLQVGGDEIADPKDLARKVAAIAPDSNVAFTIYRDGRTETLNVKLGAQYGEKRRADRPDESPAEHASLGSLGLTLSTAEGGVVISSVTPGGPADRTGLKPGDRIVEVGGEAVSTSAGVEGRIKAMTAKGRKAVLMLVRSGNDQRFVAVELDRG